jgi:hypothetical protein
MRQRSITYWTLFYTAKLYKYNALDARLYTRQGFIFSKQVPMDSAIKGGIKDLTEWALSLSDDRLKSNPRDAEALYNRGITEGLRSRMLSSTVKPPSPSTARHKKRKPPAIIWTNLTKGTEPYGLDIRILKRQAQQEKVCTATIAAR